MIYFIWLKKKRGGSYLFEESLLPGVFNEKAIQHTHVDTVEKLVICVACSGKGTVSDGEGPFGGNKDWLD
nr:hypothetical protein [Desulfobacteraceae bacterium]